VNVAIPTLADESRAQHGFYVPQFEIRIEGVGLPRDVLRDVSQVTYRDSLKEIDGFELTINNWDAATRRFKYVGSESPADLQGSTEAAQRVRLFDPCNKEVDVRVGYLGDLHTLVRGTFTTLEPTFPSGGAPTLAVRGLNALHKLRRKQYSTTWGDKRDSEIARNIGQLTDPKLGKNQKRFPMPIVISDEALAQEKAIPYVAQQNQYDIDFLFIRAKRLGYVVCIREGDPKAKDPNRRKTHLYFGPSDGRRPGATDPIYKLRWGASLIDFKPTLTTANQVKSVTVKGWDRTKKKEISVKVSLDDREMAVNKDLHDLLNNCDPREEVVVEKPVHSAQEAKKVALGILKDRQKEMVKAAASCVGLPALTAGTKVEIEGLGARFSGTYYVTSTTHTVGDSGYTTRFEARREVTGSLAGVQ
jgi:Bacteriophage probable baseplate hub protein